MKNFKIILISMTLGLLVGVALGVNMGRDRPLLSNPFAKDSIVDRAKQLGSETLEKSGKALEKTGQALQGK